ncbi:hypothetical protein H5410_027922 [Solanum commersonii]|uniref:RING-type E3 ubiquitin transferase n=1 Tax=Solanum commersonii TaxID=4109 RepID=A0A9J5Z5Y1_SOLCO|nr:hypothetical protein H5410_027922 [Solanum commersonii]
MEEKPDVDILRYYKTRIHHVVAHEDGNLKGTVEENLQGQSKAYMEETPDEDILRYYKTRIHHVVAHEDGVNSSTNKKKICGIYLAEYENEEITGTLWCDYEYHACCIKQWLLRKRDCPICRAYSSPFTSTN